MDVIPKRKKPSILMVHRNLKASQCRWMTLKNKAYPTVGNRSLTRIGTTAPPTEAPIAISPNTSCRRLSNHWLVRAMIGANMIPHVIPVKIPWQITICQNAVHSATRKVARRRTPLAIMKGSRKYPLSKSLPPNIPGTNMREPWSEPIHAL
jgi:hypothetical protein